jgi:hypothetical protein
MLRGNGFSTAKGLSWADLGRRILEAASAAARREREHENLASMEMSRTLVDDGLGSVKSRAGINE